MDNTQELLEQLPYDQRKLIIERLGMPRLRKFEIGEEIIKIQPSSAVGDRVRGQARKSLPLTRLYWASLREMGSLEKTPSKPRVPAPAWAWIEMVKAREKPEMPTFSHKAIAGTIQYFGGWTRMWKDFFVLKETTARNRWIMAYKEMTEK